MIEIKEKQELNVTNLLSFRGKVSQAELESISKDMQNVITMHGAKPVGSAITATFAVENGMIDIEILVPIDKPLEGVGKYTFKERLHIVNAVVAVYKGHPAGLQEAIENLNRYMVDRGMQPITVGYNVTKRMDMLAPENTRIETYVGINPNIL